MESFSWKLKYYKLNEEQRRLVIKHKKVISVIVLLLVVSLALFIYYKNVHASSIGIIGGADGPTAIFINDDYVLNQSWINIFGLIFVILILIPNIIYVIKLNKRGEKLENHCNNKFIKTLPGKVVG